MNSRLIFFLFMILFSGCILKSEEQRQAEALEAYMERKTQEASESLPDLELDDSTQSKTDLPTESKDPKCKDLCRVVQRYQVSVDSIEMIIGDQMDPNCFCTVTHSSRRFGSRIPIVKDFMRRKHNYWEEKETPLYIVLMKENSQATKILLESGAWVNEAVGPKGVPLNAALWKDNTKLIDLLEKYGADPAKANLSYAQSEKVIDRFLAAGADPSLININFAIRKRNQRLVRKLMRAGAKPKEIDHHYLIRFCKPDMLKMLLEEGLNPNVQNKTGKGTLLLEACQARENEMIELLLKAGADPNIEGQFAALPLLEAIKQGNRKLLDKLLLHKAKVNPKPDDEFFFKNLMETAINKGNPEIVSPLHEAGAKVSDQHHSNYTYAVSVGADPAILNIVKED